MVFKGNKIRVVHIITLLELGGAQQNTLYTVENLDRSCFDVVLIAGSGGYLDKRALSLSNTRVVLLDELTRPVNPWKDLKALFRLRGLLSVLKRDSMPMIVHTHSGKAGVLGRAAARLAGVQAVVHHVHGLSYPSSKSGRLAAVGRLAERVVDRFTSAYISVCSANFRDGNDAGLYKNGMKEVIRSGFDTRLFHQPGVDRKQAREMLGLGAEEGPVVGMIACFKPQKNPLGFIEMSEAVLREFPQARFVIAGDGELRPGMERLAKELGVSRRVDFLGWREDVHELLRAMDVLVLMSLWEGLPRVIPQALLAGVPVVATHVDGVPEVLRQGENGYLVTPGNVNEAAERVLDLLKSGGACLDPGPDPSEYLEAFDQDRMVREQEMFYTRLLSSMGTV